MNISSSSPTGDRSRATLSTMAEDVPAEHFAALPIVSRHTPGGVQVESAEGLALTRF